MDQVVIKIKLVILSLANSKMYVYLADKGLPYQLASSSDSLDYLANEIFNNYFKLLKKSYYLEQLYTFKDEDYIDIVYYILLPKFILNNNDNKDWMEIIKIGLLNRQDQKIIEYALQRLKWKVEYTNAIYSLLPSEFTLTELQTAYEIVLGKRLDKRNFRKKIMTLKLLKSTGRRFSLGQARPAELFSFRTRELTYVKII